MWKEQAKCLGSTQNPLTDYWYPEEDDPQFKEKIKVAKRICNTCPVIKECLEYAIENEEHYGVWGAKTFKERNKIKKALASGKITSIH